MTLPKLVPTLDHVVVNTRDRIDEAADIYRALGFTLTPKGHHSLGSVNHLAIFGTDYLELIGVPDASSPRQDVMAFPPGLNGLVFGTDDSAALHAALTQSGIAASAPREFSRPVALADGTRDAVFRTVHLDPQPVWPGRIYFCHHFTRDLVWQDAFRRHANGAVGVERTLIASDDPARLGALFGRAFGASAVRAVFGGISLAVGLSRVDVLEHAAVASALGDCAPDAAGRAEYMAALTLRTVSLAQAEAALSAAPVRRHPGRLTVPAAAAFGCALEFVE